MPRLVAFAVGPADAGEVFLLRDEKVAAARLCPAEDVPPHVASDPTPVEVLRQACKEEWLWVARAEDTIVGSVRL